MASPGRRTTVDELLAEARSGLERMTPAETQSAAEQEDALIIDIRPVEQRREDGELAGAHVVARNVLEWRFDPRCPHRDLELARTDRRVILICNEGYQSSLAAATLRSFGVDATDVIGGVQEWIRSGLATSRHQPD